MKLRSGKEIYQKNYSELTNAEISGHWVNWPEVQDLFSCNWDELRKLNPVCIIEKNGAYHITIDTQDFEKCCFCNCSYDRNSMYDLGDHFYCENCRGTNKFTQLII